MGMNRSKNRTRWVIVVVMNLIIILLTIIRQIIGYGTTPKVDAQSYNELEIMLNRIIWKYNESYMIEIAIIGVLVFLLNYFLLKRFEKTLMKSLIVLIMYFFISIISMLLISYRFKSLNLEQFY